MTDGPIPDGDSTPAERRIPLSNAPDLKQQLVEKIVTTLRDEQIETVTFAADITLPPIYLDADPTDDIEITTDVFVIDADPTD